MACMEELDGPPSDDDILPEDQCDFGDQSEEFREFDEGVFNELDGRNRKIHNNPEQSAITTPTCETCCNKWYCVVSLTSQLVNTCYINTRIPFKTDLSKTNAKLSISKESRGEIFRVLNNLFNGAIEQSLQ